MSPLLIAVPLAAQDRLVEDYLERWFRTYPTRATAAGRHDLDGRLEDLGPEALSDWSAYNRATAEALRRALADTELDAESRLDYELLLRQVETELLDLERVDRDPLFWTGLLGNATLFLLVREDLPASERLASAAERARLIPRLAAQARQALAAADPAGVAPEHCAMAAGQAFSSAAFYREGFAAAAEGDEELRRRLDAAGREAAAALEKLGLFLERHAERATGSPRLGSEYARRFRIVTGVDEPVEAVLDQAEADLEAKRLEAAAYGRQVWEQIFPGAEPPVEDAALLRRLFERVAADRAESDEEFEQDYRDLVRDSIEFVRRRDLITLPEPLTLEIGRSPAYFVGRSVGGVYPAGPYAPEGTATLLFVPLPPPEAGPAERTAFFRDFNHHFNVMITPHEIVPGHYLQLKHAARHPRRVRALFPDGVYVEGWGTFCERLMLDQGWGGSLDRLAHLKKQLENIARTVVDIRVHSRGMGEREVVEYVREQALQEEQFARNMWMRAITSSPQLAFYHLGYQQVWALYRDARERRGATFDLKSFLDGMMEMGPVPVERYRARMLGPAPTSESKP